ncbi:capsid cement protein [Thalassobaculum sp.]|uniref:capsid cement protein n=1 Tax=Thalassobaculum sp. TaxID=2022740 RepID=UPI0032F01C45
MSRIHFPVYTRSIAAIAALTAHRFVSMAGGVAPAGGMALGVGRMTVASGDMQSVDVIGTSPVEAAGAIVSGGLVEVGADGKGVAYAGGIPVAVALEAAAADGDFFEAFMLPTGLQSRSVTTLTLTATVAANRFVDADGDHATAAGNALGVALVGGDAGDAAHVQASGVVQVEAVEAITAKGLVEVGAAGKAAAKAAGTTVARAIDAAAADGDLIRVCLIPN